MNDTEITTTISEIVEPLFASNYLHIPSYRVRRCDGKDRWYELMLYDLESQTYIPAGEFRPSVTTVLGIIAKGIGFDMWLGNSATYDLAMEYAQRKAIRGTNLHNACATLAMGGELNVDRWEYDELKHLYSFLKWQEDYHPEYVGIEIPLFDTRCDFSGTADFICNIGGENVLIDLKTGRDIYDTHIIQVSMYIRLINLIFPDLNVKKGAVLRTKEWTKEVPTYEYKVFEPVSDDIIDGIVFLWKYMKRDSIPEKKVRFANPLNIETFNDYLASIQEKGTKVASKKTKSVDTSTEELF